MSETGPLRSLTPDELGLLRWMFELGTEDMRSFAPQLEGIRGARWCDCGCPSIRLEVAEGLSLGRDRGQRVIGDFEGKTQRGELVGALLFQRGGKLELLEVYSMDDQIAGDSSEFGLPLLDSLRLLEWEPVPGHPSVKRQIKSP